MEFRPSATVDGRTAIEVWDQGELVATLYAQPASLHLVCQPTHEPAALELQIHDPRGVVIALTRRDP